MTERSRKIEEILRRREIDFLLHFSRDCNADSIEELGIFPVTELEKRNIDYQKNDYKRLDGRKNCISLSIYNINYLFLRTLCHEQKWKYQYFIYYINPKILLEGNRSFFCYENAAKSEFKNASDEYLSQPERLNDFFIGDNTNKPFSPQAEILFEGNIPPKYICEWKVFNHENNYQYVL